MFKILISSKLASVLRHEMTKHAADWRDQYVMHTTPGGKQTRVKIRSLPPHEQAKYAPQKATKNEFMPIPQIQAEIKDFQTAYQIINQLTDKSNTKDLTDAEQTQLKAASRKSDQSFIRLYNNFFPTIANTISKVIGSRKYHTTRQDMEDIKQQASQIFFRALTNAQPDNQGIVSYINTTLYQQLKAKARDIYRSSISMDSKEREKLRAIQRYVNNYHQEHGDAPQDYDQMAREINKKENVTTDAAEISALLQSGVISLEEKIDEGGGSEGRDVHEVLGPSKVEQGAAEILPTPEEEQIQKDLRETILKSIESIGDETKEKVLKLKFGYMPQSELPEGYFEGEQLNPRQISEILGMPRSTVTREIDRAEARLRQNKDIQRLRHSSSILRIIKSYNKHLRFAYVPDSVVKISKDSILMDDKFVVKKFANQIVCSCGKDCFHRDAAKQYLN